MKRQEYKSARSIWTILIALAAFFVTFGLITPLFASFSRDNGVIAANQQAQAVYRAAECGLKNLSSLEIRELDIEYTIHSGNLWMNTVDLSPWLADENHSFTGNALIHLNAETNKVDYVVWSEEPLPAGTTLPSKARQLDETLPVIGYYGQIE